MNITWNGQTFVVRSESELSLLLLRMKLAK